MTQQPSNPQSLADPYEQDLVARRPSSAPIRLQPTAYDIRSRVMAFDPGPHTGVAYFIDGEYQWSIVIQGSGRLDHYLQLKRMVESIRDGVSVAATLTVIVEDFRSHFAITREGADTLNYVGWIEGCALLQGIPVVKQMPASKEPFLELARTAMRADKTGARETRRHRVDAVAHALAFFASEKH